MEQTQSWIPYAALTKEDMKDTNHFNEFKCGFYVPLNGEEFRLFVLNETLREARGYMLKLMYKNGRVRNFNFDTLQDMVNYPHVIAVFNNFNSWTWINKGTWYHCYKYVEFGHGKDREQLAINLMNRIVDYIHTLED